MFRRLSIFPGPFTLEAAEAVAGAAPSRRCCTWWIARCSPAADRAGWPDPVPDAGDAARLRGRAAGRGRGAARPRRRWPGMRCGWPSGRRGAADQHRRGVAAARWLDAEDATMQQALAWALEHDPATAVRLAAALGWWWLLRAASRGSTGCCARSPDAPRRAATAGARAALGCLAAIFSSDLAGAEASPVCGTRPRAGGRPGRWPTG